MGVSGGPFLSHDSSLVLSLDAADRNSYTSGSNTWFDLSGNGNSGSLTNGPGFTGSNGGAIVFDGVDDYVNLETPSILNITSNITINSWVNVTSFPTNLNVGTIYEKGYDNVADQVFFRFANSASIIGLSVGTYKASTNTNYFTQYIIGSTITTGSWNNIVGQYDGANWSLFLNGSLVSRTLTNQGPLASTAPVSIGAAYITNAFSRFLTGRISSVQVYNRALSAQEIQQNYNQLKSRFNL